MSEARLVGFRRALWADLLANTGRVGWRGLLAGLVFEPAVSTLLLHRMSQALYARGFRRLAKLLWRVNVSLSACHIHIEALIGPGLKLPHPTGVVIGEGAEIGSGVTIYQHVTVGRARNRPGYPRVGDGAVLYPSSVVVGDIAIGAAAVIGAGSVVRSDIPAGAIAAGNPARLLHGASRSAVQGARLVDTVSRP